MKRRLLVALVAVAVIIIALAYGVQIATPPTSSPTPEVTPTVPTQTPTPHTMPPYAPISIKSNASYGFDQTYLQEEHFVLSRGKSATLIIILTSTANRTLHLTPSAERLPTGVTAEFDSQFLALEPNKPVTVKLTVTVSSTAPETNRESAVLNFMLQEEGFRFKTNYYFFYLTIV